MKRILIISTSPRTSGNSEILAHEFAKGARDAGHEPEMTSLNGKTIQFCKGCLTCQTTRRCVIHDDMDGIVRKMKSSDVLVFATPIYFYEMCGQMKTLLDRTNPLFPADYAFRDVYLLATAADAGEHAVDGAVNGLQGWLSCFAHTCLKGVVKGLGADRVGAVKEIPEALKAAYEMGRNV